MSPPEPPITRVRFLIPVAAHVTFFAAIALSPSGRVILIPAYMLILFGLIVGFNLLEGFRLKSFLKHRYPAECEKLTRQAGYGPNFALGLNSSHPWWGFRFAVLVLGGGNAEGEALLKRLRRHQRWIWVEAVSLPPVMFLVVVSAGTVSSG